MLVRGVMFFEVGNYVEAGLWTFVALVCVVYAFRRTGLTRRRCWQAAFVFFVFGCSDIVEAQTGAWWRPWWLLVWKVICVVALVALLVDYRQKRRRAE